MKQKEAEIQLLKVGMHGRIMGLSVAMDGRVRDGPVGTATVTVSSM